MKQTLQHLPEPHTDFTIRLTLDSPVDVIALLCVAAAIIALAVWWFAVKRPRR